MSDLPNANPASRGAVIMDSPDQMRKVRDLFGIDSDMEVPAFSEADERVPDLDPAYVFDPDIRPVEGTTKPEAELAAFRAYEEVDVAGFRMLPLAVPHGQVEAFGFRVGDLGYITDAKRLPDRTRKALAGVRVLVLNALWYGNPHPTHFTVEEAVEAAEVDLAFPMDGTSRIE